MKAKIGDIYTMYQKRLKRYTACQMIKMDDEKILCLGLDWTGEEPLRADQIDGLAPLYKDFMYWERRICSMLWKQKCQTITNMSETFHHYQMKIVILMDHGIMVMIFIINCYGRRSRKNGDAHLRKRWKVKMKRKLLV